MSNSDWSREGLGAGRARFKEKKVERPTLIQCSMIKSFLTQCLGQQSVPAGRHAALASHISGRGFTGSCRFRPGRCVIPLIVAILRGPDFSALSPSVGLSRKGSQMFRIQRGFGLVMIVVTIFSSALRPPRPSEDAGFHNTRVLDSVGHHESILVMSLCVASVMVLHVLEVRTAPFWKRGDFAKRWLPRGALFDLNPPEWSRLRARPVTMLLPGDLMFRLLRSWGWSYPNIWAFCPVGREEAGVSRV
ncbi:hypothetical protein FQN60_004905 [Etheostoma spectabile]|uniref:Uncharacterized protein n=1 Tax=Etheostoma spectabile TaxID=54343 RepID=A0A5J5DL64_9PERO|nr:hypothetical protein FQN60_004905 [Etheostoma spectabile]